MSADIFVPTSNPQDALVHALHTITYVSSDKAGIEKTLAAGLDLESTPWHTPVGEERKILNTYFGIEDDIHWETSTFFRSGAASNVQIRVIAVQEETAIVRPTVDGRHVGGLSIGFPMADLAARKARMSQLGVESSVGIKEMAFTSPAGEVYTSAEIHFLAVENVFLLGVLRPEVFIPVGPIDAETGIGAPAYSARCVSNPEQVIDFLRDVLGFEIRRDAMFEVGVPSGLKLTAGLPERFVQIFAPGSSSGYLVLLDHLAENRPSPAPTLGPPSRGMCMWSFPSSELDTVHERAVAAGIEVLHPPQLRSIPSLPKCRTLLLNDPGGFPIEIFEL